MTTIAAAEFLPLVATAGAARDALVVSVHDVAPSTQKAADNIISELARRGVRTCSLLVVPDYHHQGLFTKNRQFVSWLQNLEADGYEIVVHGYCHHRPRRPNETMRDKFLTRFYTNEEAEFYDLGYEEALRRITIARNEFQMHGLKPRGFVAPGWLLSADTERAARDAELEYTTRLRAVRDLRSGENFPARSIVYSVQNSWRRAVSISWNAALFHLLKNDSLLRISIHPPDYSHPETWQQIVGLIDAASARRSATTYQEWIAEQRLRRGT
jgi:uncharacterized protein